MATSTKAAQSGSERDFEQRLEYTRIGLSLIEPEFRNAELETIRMIVLVWDKIKAVSGDFSIKDAQAIKAKIEAIRMQEQGETSVTQE